MRGSIKKRVNKNSVVWSAVVDLPRGLDGKRVQKRITAPTRKAAEEKIVELLHEANIGILSNSSEQTLETFLNAWMRHKIVELKPASQYTYENRIRKHIIPVLGDFKIGDLRTPHIQTFYADCLRQGMAPATVSQMHGILHNALAYAAASRLIRYNPCEAAIAPKPDNIPATVWNLSEVRTFLQASADDDLAALWRLALMTGMRKGEMLALRWQDVNLKDGWLMVQRTAGRGDKGPVIGSPKGTRGRRRIDLDASCIEALRRHRTLQLQRRLRLGSEWIDDDLVFDRGDGGLLSPNAPNKRMDELIVAAGVPRIRFHDLRHTAATLMLANGVHAKVVQERLGHSDISETMDRYSHVLPTMQREAANHLGDVIAGMQKQGNANLTSA